MCYEDVWVFCHEEGDTDEKRVLLETRRGGRPISSIYLLAHSPYDEVEYVIDHEHMIVVVVVIHLHIG